MDVQNQHQSTPLTLKSLPSEIRRQIVSYLAPSPQQLRPGSKIHLKNANLAHSCLREWVTEYMFENMALVHVLPGMSGNLEVFAVSRENAGLLKYVKHIVVQVQPSTSQSILLPLTNLGAACCALGSRAPESFRPSHRRNRK